MSFALRCDPLARTEVAAGSHPMTLRPYGNRNRGTILRQSGTYLDVQREDCASGSALHSRCHTSIYIEACGIVAGPRG